MWGKSAKADSTPKRRTAQSKKPAKKAPAKATQKCKPPLHKNAIPAPGPQIDSIPAPPYLKPENPQATLLGLPAEIRLEIYKHLITTTLIHVHRKDAPGGDRSYTWTPCKATNPTCSLLCLNPKWSGLCAEADRCTVKKAAPPDPRGFYGLAATSKFLRGECMESFMKDAVISVNLAELAYWMNWLGARAPQQLAGIRRLTLAGPYHIRYFSRDVPRVLDEMPGIEGIGFQVQDRNFWWINGKDRTVNTTRWKQHWKLARWVRGIDSHVTVAVETTIWMKGLTGQIVGGQSRYAPEQQAVIRVVREGKVDSDGDEGMSGTGWEDADVKLEVVQPGGLVEPKRTADWRGWWRGKDTQNFA
ncbi:hypothetical protein K458DRAFT_321611 [Lentithecium fluviatile CBS 122367]|uniref:Uncharacterized protein n=1 Tax=Lentithecium fluviatile CBS 122367 TaxID=1168545 RepID=A0A6G1IEK4_9PLEO|nr:hypothetical protein K458DRAFT_321611 [Lentithecium fluviatile CBS 122367]